MPDRYPHSTACDFPVAFGSLQPTNLSLRPLVSKWHHRFQAFTSARTYSFSAPFRRPFERLSAMRARTAGKSVSPSGVTCSSSAEATYFQPHPISITSTMNTVPVWPNASADARIAGPRPSTGRTRRFAPSRITAEMVTWLANARGLGVRAVLTRSRHPVVFVVLNRTGISQSERPL